MAVIIAMFKIGLKKMTGVLSGFFHRICAPFYWLLYTKKMSILYKYVSQSMYMIDIDERNMIF